MKLNSWLKDYLHFSRKESIAVLLIIVLIAAVYFLPDFFRGNAAIKPVSDTAWIAAIRQLDSAGRTETEGKPTYPVANNTGEPRSRYQAVSPVYFEFDPNTLDEAGWKQLGLRDRTIRTILNYRSKGGRFRKPEDLQRIYGLFPDEYERLEPYIRIAGQPATPAENFPETRAVTPALPETMPEKKYTKQIAVIDINRVDTTALLPLPGIGSKLAARILNFRDKLGGFYSVSQVGETFGLPDSTFQKMKPFLKADAGSVKKININTATVDELKAHPYIRWAIANPIVAYRNEHGPFASVADLKKIMAVTEPVYSKLEPYLTVK